MRVTFDKAKNKKNQAERNLSFERVAELDWDAAVIIEDDRHDYGERRLRVTALLEGRLHVAVVTFRRGAVHVISFRKANKREVKGYDQER